jgi:hypothetical protein
MRVSDVQEFEGLSGEPLAAVTHIWKRQRRTLTASFGGVSMSPTISAGAAVTFACGERVGVGDVAVVLMEGRILVHRIVAVGRAGWFLTRGDATWVPDPPTSAEAVVGRVVGVDQKDVPDGPPASRVRRTILALCVALLNAREDTGRGFIRLLWRWRYWTELAPLAVARRLRSDAPGNRGGHGRAG